MFFLQVAKDKRIPGRNSIPTGFEILGEEMGVNVFELQ